jgi:rubrerythrin
MNNELKFGTNLTGTATAPRLSEEMKNGADALTIPPEGSSEAIAEERTRLTQASDPVGSVPFPTTITGAVNVGTQTVRGNSAQMLIDKLGERLAFERSGVRLYEALISKLKAEPSIEPPFSLDTLERFRDEELGHFLLVEKAIVEIGGDPTVMTPCADVMGVANLGLLKVVTDPMIKFPQALQAVLTAELTDNAAWELLIPLAEHAGLVSLTEQFEDALEAEQEHLITVRQWLENFVLGDTSLSQRVA